MKTNFASTILIATFTVVVFGCDKNEEDLLIDYQSHAIEAVGERLRAMLPWLR